MITNKSILETNEDHSANVTTILCTFKLVLWFTKDYKTLKCIKIK